MTIFYYALNVAFIIITQSRYPTDLEDNLELHQIITLNLSLNIPLNKEA